MACIVVAPAVCVDVGYIRTNMVLLAPQKIPAAKFQLAATRRGRANFGSRTIHL